MSNDSKGYYKALGLQPGASIDDVKKAYKKKQVDLHPSGPVRKKMRDTPEYNAMTAEQKAAKESELDELIALINSAFTVLSDEKKKKEYDAGMGEFAEFSTGGFGGFSGFSGFDGFEDLFSHMAGGRQRSAKQNKVKSVEHDIKLDIRDVFLGKKCKFRVKTTKICKVCNGKGGKDIASCSKCQGKGVVFAKFSLGIISGSQQIECPDCEGKGTMVKGPMCSECKGSKVVDDSKILEVNIKPGIEAGETISFSKQGNEYPGYVQGDVVFTIHINEDLNNFRLGDDYITTADVDILTALTGGVLYYNHPDGRRLAVNVKPFKDFDNVAIILPNEGFLGSRGVRGNVYIKPHILINPGLDRVKLGEYLKPMIHKPHGDYSTTNSTLGSLPNPHKSERRHYRREESPEGYGFDVGSFASFFS